MQNELPTLISKYNVAGPRYTSYPTVPYWEMTPTITEWIKEVQSAFIKNAGKLSLYIHLPFCESLCTYCGCSTRITVNHKVEEPYIQAILSEWRLYVKTFPFRPKIAELHFGGGTPTFFSAKNLAILLDGIFQHADKSEHFEFSIEGHPNNTTSNQLNVLAEYGFNRISFGIQDFDPKVQEIINRRQSFEKVKAVTRDAREAGFTSVNYDLVYGLPLQTESSVASTVEQVINLKPDRIAFYGYAHVPWMKPGQRRYSEADLPDGDVKRRLYEQSRKAFEDAGYYEIGMDHFALPTDELYEASKNGKLNRNFMGYTTDSGDFLLGLGVSSISDTWTCFAQNVKIVEEYYSRIEKGELPIFKGHLLNEEDQLIRKHIRNIMCRFETSGSEISFEHPIFAEILTRLQELEKDGLVAISPGKVIVTDSGRAVVRNICMAFDVRLWRKVPVTVLFSKTV